MPRNHNKKKVTKKPIVITYGAVGNASLDQQYSAYVEAEEAKKESVRKQVRFDIRTCRDFAEDLERLHRKEGLTAAQYKAWEDARDRSQS
jgi:hypothetical protein